MIDHVAGHVRGILKDSEKLDLIKQNLNEKSKAYIEKEYGVVVMIDISGYTKINSALVIKSFIHISQCLILSLSLSTYHFIFLLIKSIFFSKSYLGKLASEMITQNVKDYMGKVKLLQKKTPIASLIFDAIPQHKI